MSNSNSSSSLTNHTNDTTTNTTNNHHNLHPNLVIATTKAQQILFTQMRDKNTTSEKFVQISKRAMRLLVEDALAEFPTTPITITTPCGTCQGLQSIEPTSICAISIIRSGDALLESVREIEPSVKVGKILIQRDETTFEKIPKLYYSKLPSDITNCYILLCDPMLATGGSAIMAIQTLIEEYNVNVENIIFANMICAPEGLLKMAERYPQIKIVTACIDECLNEHKFIVPGLGDYGDRFFNTT